MLERLEHFRHCREWKIAMSQEDYIEYIDLLEALLVEDEEAVFVRKMERLGFRKEKDDG